MESDREGDCPGKALGRKVEFSWSVICIYLGNQGRTGKEIPNEKTAEPKCRGQGMAMV